MKLFWNLIEGILIGVCFGLGAHFIWYGLFLNNFSITDNFFLCLRWGGIAGGVIGVITAISFYMGELTSKKDNIVKQKAKDAAKLSFWALLIVAIPFGLIAYFSGCEDRAYKKEWFINHRKTCTLTPEECLKQHQ